MAPSGPPEILFITGTDQHLFGPTCCLLASFQHRLPGHKLYVADFGLNPEQRNLFAALGVLLEMPEAVRNQLPANAPTDRPELALAWYSKASLLEYVRDFKFDALMWIDADIVITAELAPQAERLAASMLAENKIFAAAPAASNDNIGRFIQKHLEAGPLHNVAPFAANLVNLGVPLSHPYLNSGVFIATDLDALARWRYLTCTTPAHFLFEQNAFNVIAWMEPQKLELLDCQRWNLNGLDLADMRVEWNDNLPSGHIGDAEVLMVHATSSRIEDCQWFNQSVDCESGFFNTKMKFFGNPALRALQEFYLLSFLATSRDELQSAGLIAKKSAA